MNICKDIKVEGKHGRPFLLDTFNIHKDEKLPIIILVHGFKGFKDWGHWDLIGKEMANAGFFFVKFNLSFNGTTIDKPTEFGDLKAFGLNNYTKEISDIDTVIEWLEKNDNNTYDINQIYLIGHSRGGGVSIIKSHIDKRIKKLITWASVHQLGYGNDNPDLLKEWKEKGVIYIRNGRTKQDMPLYYQLYEDVQKNRDLYHVESACKSFEKPWLIIHGTEDNAVPLSSANLMKTWNPNLKIEIIEGANHVFGGKHPFESEELPMHSRQLCTLSIDFLR